MKKTFSGSILLLAVLLGGMYYVAQPFLGRFHVPSVISTVPTPTPQSSMKLTSAAFENYGTIPKAFTCDGQKMHPPLSILDMPAGTKSLAIIVDDPDAPNGTFTHWVIWNIDPKTKEIVQGALPDMAQEGTNSSGKIGFVPPCPPAGQHRYFFTLYALDSKIGLDGKAKKSDVETAMQGHILAQSLLIGVYGR